MQPFTIKKVTMRHRGGTKEYHLVSIRKKDGGDSLLIKRWGKTGAWGQVSFERGTAFKVEDEFDKTMRSKEKRGYEVTKESGSVAVETIIDFRNSVGPGYWRELGRELPYLLPDVDPSEFKGAVTAAPPTRDEEGRPTGLKKEPKLVDDLPPRRTEEELKAANPLWGSF